MPSDNAGWNANNVAMFRAWVRPVLILAGALLAIAVFAATRASQPSAKVTAASARFVCDMHCEPGKVYDHAATCPVCRMKLRTWEEVGYSVAIDPVPPAADAISIRVLDASGIDATDAHPVSVTAVAANLTTIESLEVPARKPLPGSASRSVVFKQVPVLPQVIFAELLDASGKRVVTRGAAFAPPGSSPAPVALEEDYDVVQHDADFELRIRCNGKKFFVGERSYIRLGVSRAGATITDLQPLDPTTASRGEAVIACVDPPYFARLSPMPIDQAVPPAECPFGPEVLDEARAYAGLNGSPGDLVFTTIFPEPGTYRVWTSVRCDGRLVRAAFTIHALAKDDQPAEVQDHKHHAVN